MHGMLMHANLYKYIGFPIKSIFILNFLELTILSDIPAFLCDSRFKLA